MKRYFFLISLLPILFTSCEDDAPQLLFKFTKEIRFHLPAGLNTIDTHNFLERNIINEIQILLDQRSLTWDDVSRIDPGEVSITSFDVGDYRFMQSVSLLISNPAEPNVEKEIAFLDPVPINSKGSLHLFPTLIDLKNVFSGRTYTLRTKIRLRAITPTSIENRMLVEFLVRG